MAVTYATLFTRLGALMDMWAKVRAHQTLLRTELADVVGHYAAADMHMARSVIDNIEKRVLEAGYIGSDIKSAAEKTLIEMMDADLISSYGAGLESLTVAEAIKQLVSQMDAGSSTVDRTTITVGSVTAVSGNVGNGTLLVYDLCPIKDNPDNDEQMSAKTELITATCVADQNDTNATENQELFNISGQRAVDRMSETFPKGTGDSVTVAAASARVDGGSTAAKNVLTNSDFEAFTGDAPDNWTISAGTAGTNVMVEASSSHTQDKSLMIRCSGSLVELKQSFSTEAGTLGYIKPDTPYSFSAALRLSANASAGALLFSVRDSGGNILNVGEAGRVMSLAVAESAISHTAWTSVTATWFSPISIPKGCTFHMKATTAFNVDVLVDDVVLAEMPRLGRGNVAVQIVPLATPFAYNDRFTSQITNNNEGDFVREFDRFFNTKSLGMQLPTHPSGSETISDGLIA